MAMKSIYQTSISTVLSLFLITGISAQTSASKQGSLFGKILKKVTGDTSTTGAGLSNADIVSGLKEALNTGTQASTGKLSSLDGFLKDAAVKILLPPEAQKVEKTLRGLGMGKLVDNAITSLNRSAEDASKKAAPIFLSAIKNMSITDALGILRGGDSSATTYLRKSTTTQLNSAFRPVIDSALVKNNATKYWSDVFTQYNKISLKPVNTDLVGYVTDKAMSGIFYYVGQEEKNIRKNPAAYASGIIQKVFGSGSK
jgi:hypothetical protein